MSDTVIAQITSTPVPTIEDVISVMRQIDSALPDTDGLKWFNLLYLKVTEAVLAATAGHAWNDPAWLTRLDLVFAQMYFAVIRDPGSAPRSWQVLFEARDNPRIMRVQFAICGMNAHINHDLQFALVQTCSEMGIAPESGSPQHEDYEFVNGILEAVEPVVKEFLATGIIGQIDEDLGRIDNILAMWGVRKARETAWLNAQLFWPFRNNSLVAKLKHKSVDNITGAFGRGLIIPLL
jgi:hypothetical protein